MDEKARALRDQLDQAVSTSRARIARLITQCRETEKRADELTATARQLWARRVHAMQTRSTANAAEQMLEQ